MATSYRKSYPRKPQTPEQQLASACERATKDGIKVAGSGTMSDGRRFWIVESQSVSGMHHVVSEHGKSLQCDCLYATMQKKICVHRASIYLHIKAAAAMVHPASTMRAVADAAVAQAAQPTPTPAQPPKVHPEFQKKLDRVVFPKPAIIDQPDDDTNMDYYAAYASSYR